MIALGLTKRAIRSESNKRIQKIEEELSSLGVDPSKLKQPQDEDEELLNDLNSDEDVDEKVEGLSDDEVEKENAKAVARMPTMEEKKKQIVSRSSQVVNDFADQDIDELLEKRFTEYINAIEYLKKNNLSKDNKTIMAILEKAEYIKKLQKKRKRDEEVEIYKVPGEVQPDDILGISSKDRIKKFQILTTHVNKTMNDLKMIGSNNFKIFNSTKNATAKENYERSVALFKKQAQLKKDLVELAKNRWQPMPDIQTITENFTDVKKTGGINASVTNVNIKLMIPDGFRNNRKFYYKFKWMDENQTLKKVKVDNKGEEQEKSFEIDFGHHTKLSDLKIAIKVKQSSFLVFNKTLHVFDTNLAAFKKSDNIKRNFKFQDHKFYVT